MAQNQLYEMKFSNIMKTLAREEGAYVPTMVPTSYATIAWAGKRAVDVLADPDPNAYVDAFTAVFAEMWADGYLFGGGQFSARLGQALHTPEHSIGPDGTTVEHVQRSPMAANEYDLFLADLDKYIADVLLPRKYPQLFTDRDYAKNALKVYAEDVANVFGILGGMAEQRLKDKYGLVPMLKFEERFEPPLDMLFDYFRGFRGTLTDLRRQPGNVKAAIDLLWEKRCKPLLERPLTETFPYPLDMTHIPAYLSPKQFEELYWPHHKQQIMRIAEAGSKAYIMLEGRWENIWHHFRELPKDCCILHIDDDDIIKAHEQIGDCQILCGGLKAVDVRMKTFEQIKDDVKRVIDTCAPGGGFLYSSDKTWTAAGDVNQTLIDTYNFVHEYSSK